MSKKSQEATTGFEEAPVDSIAGSRSNQVVAGCHPARRQPKGQARCRRLGIRFTAQERHLIAIRAGKVGLTPTAYVRLRAVTEVNFIHVPPDQPGRLVGAIGKLSTELARIRRSIWSVVQHVKGLIPSPPIPLPPSGISKEEWRCWMNRVESSTTKASQAVQHLCEELTVPLQKGLQHTLTKISKIAEVLSRVQRRPHRWS